MLTLEPIYFGTN